MGIKQMFTTCCGNYQAASTSSRKVMKEWISVLCSILVKRQRHESFFGSIYNMLYVVPNTIGRAYIMRAVIFVTVVIVTKFVEAL